jgi:hypothetical protein
MNVINWNLWTYNTVSYAYFYSCVLKGHVVRHNKVVVKNGILIFSLQI